MLLPTTYLGADSAALLTFRLYFIQTIGCRVTVFGNREVCEMIPC